ncbi:hypothetical protein ACFLQG_01510 [Candidatus Zixiibacteriota bacterium]
MRNFFILIVIAIIFVACGRKGVMVFYDGERRTPTEVATLEIGNVYLMSIDTLKRRYQAISEKYIEVLPGQHMISVNYSSWKGRSTKPISLEFTAESGHKYLVKARAGYKRWTSWIIDVALDSLVAGSLELDDGILM